MNIYVIIPALNEEKVIGPIIKELTQLYRFTVVVIDDGSDDQTASVAENEGAIVLRHLINRGQGASLKTGITYALENKADIIVTFDADGQHKTSDIQKLIQPILDKKTQVVLGSRFLNNTFINMPVARKLVLKMAIVFTKVTSGLKITDTHNGLRAFSKEAIEKIKLRQDRMAHASEILDEIHRHKLSYIEVPVTVEYDQYSKGKGQSSLAFIKILIRYILGRLS